MTKKLQSDWFRNKNPKQKEEIEFILRNNVLLVSTILEILKRYEDEELRSQITVDQYENPSWAYRQADINGARRAISKVRSLFNMETSH